jgi:CPA1 family monovalent cation:H+ antiporter
MFFVILALLGGLFFKWTLWRPYSFILLLFGVSIGVIQQQFQQYSVIGTSIEYWSGLPANKLLLYFIPPIIYQAALFVNFHMFKKLFVLVMVLSCFGVVVTFLLSIGFIYGIDSRFRNSNCLLLACVLSAIDPVSITSVLSEVKLSEKLSNLIEIESLFNDEITLLIFYFLVKYLLYSSSIPYLLGETIKQIGGSIFISLCVMMIQLVLLRKVYGDFTSQLTLSLCCCYLAYFVSEYTILDTSGILSVLVLGLCMSGFGRTRLRPETLEHFELVWTSMAQYSTT